MGEQERDAVWEPIVWRVGDRARVNVSPECRATWHNHLANGKVVTITEILDDCDPARWLGHRYDVDYGGPRAALETVPWPVTSEPLAAAELEPLTE